MREFTYEINHEYFKDKDRIKQVHELCLKFKHELLLNESIVIKNTKETEEMFDFLFYWSLMNFSEED